MPLYLRVGDEKTAVRFKVDIHCSDSGKKKCLGFLSAHPEIKIEDMAHNSTTTYETETCRVCGGGGGVTEQGRGGGWGGVRSGFSPLDWSREDAWQFLS